MFCRFRFAPLVLVQTVLLILAIGPAHSKTVRTEDFSEDPNWDSVNNRIDSQYTREVVQDFGFSDTNHAGGKEVGEIGGTITRTLTQAYYAIPIEEKTLQDKLTASGRLAVPKAAGGSAVLFGWFNSKSDGWRTPNSLVFRLDGNGDKYWVFFEYGTQAYGTGGGETFEGDRYQTTASKPIAAGGESYQWKLEYDPEGAGGMGEISFTFDGKTFVAALTEGHKEQGAVFNRFGLLNQMTSGESLEIYLDDLVLGGKELPIGKDAGWEGNGNRVTFTDRIVRPHHDFGFSPTAHAGGEAGEMGGIAWRVEQDRTQNAGYYGDRIGKLTLNDPLEASGKMTMLKAGADSAVLIGWFNSKTFREGPTPRNFIGVMIEGPSRVGHYFRPVYAIENLVGGVGGEGPLVRPDGSQHVWSVRYDPQAQNGLGEMTVRLDGQEKKLSLDPGAREGGGEFDRFGWVTYLHGGHHVEIYFDDLAYTASDKN